MVARRKRANANHESPLRKGFDGAHVELEFSPAAVGEVVLESIADRGKGELIPGNLRLGVEPDLEGFGARVDAGVEQAGAEQQVDLAYVWDVVDRVERSDLDARVGFFQCFALGALLDRFPFLQVTRGHRPQAMARLDCPPAQQDPAIPLNDAAHDHARVLIVNDMASVADVAFKRIAGRHAQRHRGAALAAKLHGLGIFFDSLLYGNIGAGENRTAERPMNPLSLTAGRS